MTGEGLRRKGERTWWPRDEETAEGSDVKDARVRWRVPLGRTETSEWRWRVGSGAGEGPSVSAVWALRVIVPEQE